jgi:hypothetical protein
LNAPGRVLSSKQLQPVVQQDRSGCAIASVAALADESYLTVKRAAASLGIHVSDSKLWSDTRHVRRLLSFFAIAAGKGEEPFTAWESLPARALLAIKWHKEKTGPAWHWVVFARDEKGSCVLDPKRSLRTNRRTDFGRMKPKWFIALPQPARRSPRLAPGLAPSVRGTGRFRERPEMLPSRARKK